MPIKKLGLAFALFLFFTGLAGAIPAGFNIQGRLTDMNGVNRDGTYQMTFSIFNVETGGTALWEQNFSLSVKNGNFQVILQGLDKNNKPLEDTVKNLEAAYVEITVSGESPMVPRQPLLRSPFGSSDNVISPGGVIIQSDNQNTGSGDVTIKTGNADRIVAGNNGNVYVNGNLYANNMIGAVMFFAGTYCPQGWWKVDGSTLSKSGVFSGLFNYIQYTYGGSGDNFVLPNMSDGSFIRATGGNAANIGIKQQDVFQGHYHRVTNDTAFPYIALTYGVNSLGQYGFYNKVTDVNSYGITNAREIYSDGPSGNPRISNETRPRNYSMIPCIKY